MPFPLQAGNMKYLDEFKRVTGTFQKVVWRQLAEFLDTVWGQTGFFLKLLLCDHSFKKFLLLLIGKCSFISTSASVLGGEKMEAWQSHLRNSLFSMKQLSKKFCSACGTFLWSSYITIQSTNPVMCWASCALFFNAYLMYIATST